MRRVALTLRPAASKDDYSAEFLSLPDFKPQVNRLLSLVDVQAGDLSSALKAGARMAAFLYSTMSQQRDSTGVPSGSRWAASC